MSGTHPVQLVQPDGQRVWDPEHSKTVADIDNEKLWSLYRDMVVSRRIDIEATALQRQGQLGLWTPLLGQEAAQVGSAHALASDDFAFVSYRDTAVAYCRGAAIADIPLMWRGVSHHTWNPNTIRTSNPDIIVGAHGLHATGYAFAAHLDGAECATIAYFGDGATSQGDTSEAMTFAASWGAPVVFFCQNNHWAISVPVRTQSTTPLARRAEGFGIPSVQVDGNDVLAVLAVTREALQRARSGSGPSFIEAITYRMGPHTTADDPSRYRDAAETEQWARRDPIDRVWRLFQREGSDDPAKQQQVRQQADAVAQELRSVTIGLADPPPTQLFDHVYAGQHPLVDAQRQALKRSLAAESPYAGTGGNSP